MDAIVMLGVAVVIGLGVAGVFAFVFAQSARATARFRGAIDRAFPALARTHGMIMTEKGSPDGLPRLDGQVFGVHLTIELYLARFESRDFETGRPSETTQPATRIYARAKKEMPGPFALELGAMMDGARGYAIRHAEHVDDVVKHLAGTCDGLLNAFGLERVGSVRTDGEIVVLEWYCAEDDVEVLTEGAELVAALAGAERILH